MGVVIKSKDFNNGIVLNDVYCMVDTINGSKNCIMYSVKYYASIDARINGLNSICEISRTFQPNNDDAAQNIFKQCYTDLKTNDPEFTESLDVLEEGQTL